jgi:hypothetical protein
MNICQVGDHEHALFTHHSPTLHAVLEVGSTHGVLHLFLCMTRISVYGGRTSTERIEVRVVLQCAWDCGCHSGTVSWHRIILMFVFSIMSCSHRATRKHTSCEFESLWQVTLVHG